MLALKIENHHFYLKNCSPVALPFKDIGGLANHPLNYHPQGVFGSRESGRKGEKMREKKSSGKTPAQHCLYSSKEKKIKIVLQDFI